MRWASLQEKAEIEHVEVCPQAMKVTAEIAKRVGEDGGGALIVDYGDDKLVSDSLQVCHSEISFRSHDVLRERCGICTPR